MKVFRTTFNFAFSVNPQSLFLKNKVNKANITWIIFTNISPVAELFSFGENLYQIHDTG